MPVSSDSFFRRRPGLLATLALAAGVLLGVTGLIAAEYAGWRPASLLRWAGLGTAASEPRTWRVGLEADADFPTIAEALSSIFWAGTAVLVAGDQYWIATLPAVLAVVTLFVAWSLSPKGKRV